jgi:xylulokinase
LLRAVLEGVGCSVRHVLGAAEELAGAVATEVRVAGGGARLELWNQIKADLTGRPMRPCATSENGVVGTAMLAALGAGIYSDVPTAGEAMVQLLEPLLPDAGREEMYDTLFERYVAFYPRVRDLMS